MDEALKSGKGVGSSLAVLALAISSRWCGTLRAAFLQGLHTTSGDTETTPGGRRCVWLELALW